MAFTIKDYHDLTKVLRENPEWREELRHLLLSEELLTLPEAVRQLTLAQQRAEERLSRLETIVERLAEGQERLTEQVSALAEGQKRLIERVDTLTEGQKHLAEGQEELKDRVGGLEDRVGGLEDSVDGLKDSVGRLEDRVGELNGRTLETTYRNRASAYFGPLLVQPKVTEMYTLEALEEALATDEFHDIFRLDLLVTGKLRNVPESPDILLAMEISSVVDITDVSRAVHRASLLRKAGYHAVPVVAGIDMTQGASKAVQEQNVVFLQDGQVMLWKEAVANWEDIQLAEN